MSAFNSSFFCDDITEKKKFFFHLVLKKKNVGKEENIISLLIITHTHTHIYTYHQRRKETNMSINTFFISSSEEQCIYLLLERLLVMRLTNCHS